MYVISENIKNYRNIKEQIIKYEKGINILSGENAQGKTNIIESLWLFSAFKSFRNSTEKDFINHDCLYSDIKMEYNKNNRIFKSRLKYENQKKREIYINDIKMKPSEAIGKFLTVLFIPDHLNLIKQGPEERRKFIDFSLCQIKPGYFSILNEYNKILFQRNNVLKSQNTAMIKTLPVWNEKLSKTGAIIYFSRKQYINMLLKYSKSIIYDMSDGKENIGIFYKSDAESCENIKSAENLLYEKILESQNKDMNYGFSSVGIHKDNIEFEINGYSAKKFASQGQQRSIVMALKISETEILKDIYNEYPILLFDDVFSELDNNRKKYIVEKIKNKQVIITSCEEVNSFNNAKKFKVNDGLVKEL